MAGTMIEQFFGSDNKQAKEELMTGAKSVIIYEQNSKNEPVPLYKIEVVE